MFEITLLIIYIITLITWIFIFLHNDKLFSIKDGIWMWISIIAPVYSTVLLFIHRKELYKWYFKNTKVAKLQVKLREAYNEIENLQMQIYRLKAKQ